ncbi:hypothetical protein BsWGS_20737 [Bradybaena similaris]
MAKYSFILLGIFVLTCGTATSGQQAKMSMLGTNDILQKLQPEIGQISKLLATSAGHGTPETERKISKHIRQSLEVVLEKWEMFRSNSRLNCNGAFTTDSTALCCRCDACSSTVTACGRTCCDNGAGRCVCDFCSSDKLQNVLKVGNGKTTSVNLWLESAKNQLQASLADLIENINTEKSKCCTCLICKRKTTSCLNPFCCAKGGKRCKCITCSAVREELDASMDSVSDSTTLTVGTQPALDRIISALFDNLRVLMNIP